MPPTTETDKHARPLGALPERAAIDLILAHLARSPEGRAYWAAIRKELKADGLPFEPVAIREALAAVAVLRVTVGKPNGHPYRPKIVTLTPLGAKVAERRAAAAEDVAE